MPGPPGAIPLDTEIKPPQGFDPSQGIRTNPGAPGASDRTVGPPAGAVPGGSVRPPVPSVGAMVTGRLLGSDIDKDPAQWPRLATTIIGAITGGAIGSRFPVHPLFGMLAGSAAGATLGAAAPETLLELAEGIGVVPPGTRNAEGLNARDLQTVMEGEAVVDIVTNGGLLGVRLMGRGATTALTGAGSLGNKGGNAAAKAAWDANIGILPVQVGDRVIGRRFVTVFGRMPWMAGPLKRQAQGTEDELAAAIQGLPSRLASAVVPLTDVSKEMLADAKGVVNKINDEYTRRFDNLFTQAEQLGIEVQPVVTAQRSADILAAIEKSTTKAEGGGAAPGVSLESGTYRTQMQDFINTNVIPMLGQLPKSGATTFEPQQLRAMDTLLSQLDEFGQKLLTTKAKPGTSSARELDEVIRMSDSLRMAVFQDVVGNASQRIGAPGAGGVAKLAPLTPPAQAVVKGFNDTSNELSTVMNDLMDNAAAKRFGVVRSRALRGGAVTDEATTTATDNLAKTIISSESPEIIGQLQNLIDPPTFNRLAGGVINDYLETSVVRNAEGKKIFDIDQFAKLTGLDAPNSGRYLQTKELLDRAGGLGMEDLQKLVDVARKIGDIEIPDVSTFVARRAVMGGLRSGIGAIGGNILTGAAAGYAANHNPSGGATGAIVMAAFTIGGARLFSKMISNPLSAQALRTVMNEEASLVNRRAAAAKAVRVGIWAGANQEWVRDKAAQMDEAVAPVIKQYFDQLTNATPKF